MLNVDIISGSKSGTSYSDRVLTVCTIGYKCHWSIPMHIVAFSATALQSEFLPGISQVLR